METEKITKREYFAGLAMQGMFSQTSFKLRDTAELSTIAVKCADALIAELNKTEPGVAMCCTNGEIVCPGCEGDCLGKTGWLCAGCNGNGVVTCGKCGGKNVKRK